MNKKAVVLLSGGLDSTLAACIVKEQGIQVEAINFQTMFGCCKDDARQVAHDLGIGYTMLKVGDDYLDMIKKPKYGYGRGINPCVDCRGYMFDLAKKYMLEIGASFLISGEVLNQRPMSQKKKDFVNIEKETGLEDLILRPLSAKRLPLTQPEKAGIIDREKLYGIEGRSRKVLHEIASKYGIDNPPDPSAGCALTSPIFAKKVRDVYDHSEDYKRWEFELLRVGRHFRLAPEAKAIVAKNEQEGAYLESLHPKGTVVFICDNFRGPVTLLVGKNLQEHYERAASIMLRYSQKPLPESPEIKIITSESQELRVFNQIFNIAEVDKLRITGVVTSK